MPLPDRAATVVVVFPGQGSQKPGMGRDFVERWAEAASVFDEASEALGEDLRHLCFEDGERIHLTAWTQPALLTTEIAMYRVLEARFGLRATHFGGHSLGEWTALVAAGVLPLAEAVRLVHLRGRLMQEAVPPGEGAMAALLGRGLDRVAVDAACQGLQVVVANHNSPDQLVISGLATDLELAVERVEASLGRDVRVRRLAVSAPFHSPLMAPVEPALHARMGEGLHTWSALHAERVACNLHGGFHEPDAEAVRDALTGQISGSVRWVDNMRALAGLQPATIYEVGPARPLRGFFRTLGVSVEAITNPRMAERALG